MSPVAGSPLCEPANFGGQRRYVVAAGNLQGQKAGRADRTAIRQAETHPRFPRVPGAAQTRCRAMPKPSQPSEEPVARSDEPRLKLSMMLSPPSLLAGDDTRRELPAEEVNEPLNQTVRDRLVQALVTAGTRKRRRGPPASPWRQLLAVPMAQVMTQFPDETLTALAQMLKELDLENIRAGRLAWGLPDEATIKNYLSDVRNGRPVTGRNPLK